MSEPRALKAQVSHNHCVGAGMCVYHAPEAFRFNQERLAEFMPDGAWTAAEVREAIDSCPMSAISLIDDEADD